jgi:hypothetical protein
MGTKGHGLKFGQALGRVADGEREMEKLAFAEVV